MKWDEYAPFAPIGEDEKKRWNCKDPECEDHPGYFWCNRCDGWIDGQPCD